MKNYIKKFGKKAYATLCVVLTLVAVFVVSAAAETTTGAGIDMGDVTSTITGSFSGMIQQLVQLVMAILPIGLTLLGVSIGVSYALKWIRKITKA